MGFSRIQTIVMAVAAIAMAGGGFAAGVTAAPALGTSAGPAPQITSGPARRNAGVLASGAPGADPAGALAQQTTGRVISVGDGSITIEVRQPGGDATRSVIALVADATRLVRTVEQELELADIKAGDQVVVLGTADQATGTVNANAVILGAGALQQIFGGGGGIRRPGASPTATP